MTTNPATSPELLGWSDFFAEQLLPEEQELARKRVSSVHRTRIEVIDAEGRSELGLPPKASTADFAVGDWVLMEPGNGDFVRRLERKTVFHRRAEGAHGHQLAAANIDTLFIVTSCNADFNPARLERYLTMANEAGTTPVIVLTKADTADDAAAFETQARALQRALPVVVLNARTSDAVRLLEPWCGPGQTVALVGSSGVGKSTLVNTLSESDAEAAQKTGSIRERDAKGRHTTTARSLHATPGGAWIIDTPGIRTLYVSDITAGIDTLFAEITELAPHCRFRDCTHAHEPGCAVQAAIKAGTLDPERLDRWRTLTEENRARTPVVTGARGNKRTKTNKY